MFNKYEVYDSFYKMICADGPLYLYDCRPGCQTCPVCRTIDHKCMINEKLYSASDPKDYRHLRTWNDVKVFVEEVYRELHN